MLEFQSSALTIDFVAKTRHGVPPEVRLNISRMKRLLQMKRLEFTNVVTGGVARNRQHLQNQFEIMR